VSRITNRPLTKPSEPHRFADLGQVIASILLLIIPALLYASQRAKIHDARERVSQLESRLLRLRKQRELLLVEFATEQDPRRLEQRAKDRANLGEPVAGQVTYLPRPGHRTNPPALLAATLGDPDGHP